MDPVKVQEVKDRARALVKAGSDESNLFIASESLGNTSGMATAFEALETSGGPVHYLLMNPRKMAIPRKFWRDQIDIETLKDLTGLGIRGYMWGATIIVDAELPEDVFVLLSDSHAVQVKILPPVPVARVLHYVNHIEMQRINEWTAAQMLKAPSERLGGVRFGFEFTDCGVGTSVDVVDMLTHEELHATDLDSW